MPKLLITGAAGFIGMHTAQCFLKNGWDVIGLDNFNDYYSVSLKRDRVHEIEITARKSSSTFQMIEADINSEIWSSLGSYDFDAVVHLAAQAGVRYSILNPRQYIDANILGFQSVLEFVAKSKIERFLYASSSSVYGKTSSQPFKESENCNNPESYYAATKMANELMAASYNNVHGTSSIGLRFFTVYGPWGRPDMAPMLFAKSAYLSEPIDIYNYGNQKRDFTYIDDIVQGIFLLTTKEVFPKESIVCNIGRGHPIGLIDFIKILEKHLNYCFEKRLVESQKGDVESTYADTTYLKSIIDYHPMVELDEGIRHFIDWYIKYYGTILS
jgi:UDP-glucuronate 4-epimerase